MLHFTTLFKMNNLLGKEINMCIKSGNESCFYIFHETDVQAYAQINKKTVKVEIQKEFGNTLTRKNNEKIECGK